MILGTMENERKRHVDKRNLPYYFPYFTVKFYILYKKICGIFSTFHTLSSDFVHCAQGRLSNDVTGFFRNGPWKSKIRQ